jgi:hypothetical protein
MLPIQKPAAPTRIVARQESQAATIVRDARIKIVESDRA